MVYVLIYLIDIMLFMLMMNQQDLITELSSPPSESDFFSTPVNVHILTLTLLLPKSCCALSSCRCKFRSIYHNGFLIRLHPLLDHYTSYIPGFTDSTFSWIQQQSDLATSSTMIPGPTESTCVRITRLFIHPDLQNPQTLGLKDALYCLRELLLSCF